MATGAVVARIITQYTDKGSKAARRDIMKLGKDFDKFAGKVGKAFGVAAAASAVFVAKIGKDAVMAASDVSQQFGALDAVFGSNSEQLKEFSKSMVDYGLSTADAARYAALLGTQLKGLGLSEQDAIDRTKQLEILASDLAATYGGTTADAVQALSSTFKGEYNPIERYGVAIKKSDITARVAAKGLGKLKGDLLKAAEAQSAFEMIISKTSAAQGQSRREYDTLAAQLQRVTASYENIKASLGLALLPIIEKFASYITTDVLPALQKWVDTNKDELAKGLQSLGETLFTVGKLLVGFFKVFSDNIGAVKVFAAIFVGAKLASGIYTVVAAVLALRTALLAQAAAGAAAGTGLAFATAGISAGAAAVAVGAFVVASGAAYIAINKLTGATDKGAKSTAIYNSHLNDLARVAGQVAAANAKNSNNVNNSIKGTKELTAAEKKLAEARIAIKKAGLDKFDIKNVSDTDPIQLEAARLNLVKQGNLEELKKVEALMKSAEAQMKVNENAQKYADILLALADNKISYEEIAVLAAKWGLSIEAVTNYLATIFIVKDAKIDSTEVELLAAAWGISKEAAEKYLDFYAALNDGTLSDQEIAKLQTKWGLTSKEVLQYADFISKLDDFTLSDEEIKKLQDRWGLTTKEVLAYTKQIGLPVAYNGTLIAPADAAAAGWNKANSALTAYITGLNTAITQSAAANAAAVAAFEATAKAVAGAEAASAAAAKVTTDSAAAAAKITADAAADAAKVTADAAAAAAAIAAEAAETADAIIAAAEAAAALADSLKGLTADEITAALAGEAAGNGAALGGSDGVKVNPPGGDLIALASGGIVTSPTMALIGEAGPEAVIPLSRGGGFGGGITINITNAGSVIAEADLVSSIRNALLQAQNNGQVITKSAVAI